MDLLSRCVAELGNVSKVLEQADSFQSRIDARSKSPRVALLLDQLRALDQALAHRARQISIGAAEYEVGRKSSEELELEAELTSYLVRKARRTAELLQRELGLSPPAHYEEPLG